MKFSTNFYLLTIASFRIGVPSILFLLISLRGGTDYGRPERKQPSLHGRKFTPTPKFLDAAKAYFDCHIGPNFQVSLIHAFIRCPQSVILVIEIFARAVQTFYKTSQQCAVMCSIACLEAIDRIIAGLFVHTCHKRTSRLFSSFSFFSGSILCLFFNLSGN